MSAHDSWPDDVDEISGFGGGYEECCRVMFAAGLQWLNENPLAEPRFRGISSVYGVLLDHNDDAKALTRAVVDAAKAHGGATGAQHQAVVGHLMAIRTMGWDEWHRQLCEYRSKDSHRTPEGTR